MTGAPMPDLDVLMRECALGVDLHRQALERVQHMAKLLSMGKSMQDVAGRVLHDLCNDDPTDARQYLQTLQEVIASDLNVLLLYVIYESRDPKNPKA